MEVSVAAGDCESSNYGIGSGVVRLERCERWLMVLFVFVIMLLNAGEEEHTEGSRVAWLLGIPGMLAVTVIVCWALLMHSDTRTVSLGALPGPPADIAQLLFHEFLLPFEVTSILVLIAIMGVVVVAARAESTPAREEG